jgi:hypothetical protein
LELELNFFTAQTSATTQPKNVQPKNKFRTKIAVESMWLRIKAIKNGKK